MLQLGRLLLRMQNLSLVLSTRLTLMIALPDPNRFWPAEGYSEGTRSATDKQYVRS